jgi:hypothetical protein
VAEYTSPISGKKRQIPSPIEFLRAIGDYYQTLPQWTGPRRTGLANLPTDYRREELLAAGQVPGGLPADYKETELEAGRAAEAYRAGAGFPGQELAPAGLDLARPKPFAMTPEGQFDRYFKTPEFDYVFGAGSRGKGAPADAAAMEVLGNQLMAPKGTNIASMYAAQSAMGRVNQAAIQEMYKDRPDLQKWAAANPMLAQREFLKSEQRRASEMPTAPDQETVMGDLGSRAQDEGGYSLEAYGGGKPKEGEEIIDAVNFLKKKAGLQK